MSPSLARPLSTGSVNFNVLGVHSTRSRLPHSSICLSRCALTTATLKVTTNKLQRVLNATAHVVSGTHKFDSSLQSYIDWMFLSESCTSSTSWCSTACMVKRLHELWNWVRGHWKSLEMALFDRSHPSSYSSSIVTTRWAKLNEASLHFCL